MGKKVLIAVFVGLLGLIAFNWFTTGEATLIPAAPLSAQGRQLAKLESDFATAAHQFYQASHAAGMTGTDTTSEAQAALQELDRIEQAAEALKGENPSADDTRHIEQLLDNIQKIKKN